MRCSTLQRLTSSSRGSALAWMRWGKHMVKRMVDERKTADGIVRLPPIIKTGGGTSHMVIPTCRTESNLTTC
jgi:hypothetical protein